MPSLELANVGFLGWHMPTGSSIGQLQLEDPPLCHVEESVDKFTFSVWWQYSTAIRHMLLVLHIAPLLLLRLSLSYKNEIV